MQDWICKDQSPNTVQDIPFHLSLESWDGRFLVYGELRWSQRLVASKDIWASNTTILWIRCYWTDDFKIECSFGQWWMKYRIAALWKAVILFQMKRTESRICRGQICSRPCHNVHSYWVSNGRHSWRQLQKGLQSQPYRTGVRLLFQTETWRQRLSIFVLKVLDVSCQKPLILIIMLFRLA